MPDTSASFATDVEYASFWRRLGALLLDGLILVIPMCFAWVFGLASIVASVGAGLGAALGALALMMLVVAGLPFVYYVFVGGGTTLGKRALGIRVVDASTLEDITTGQAVGRYFGYILSSWVLYLGFLWAIWDERSQTWHDKLAKTVVVRA